MKGLPPIFYFLALLATSLTVKFMPLLVTPRTVTNKFPVVAPVDCGHNARSGPILARHASNCG